MEERKIIVLEGPDGVGKSTQAKMLVDELNELSSEDWILVHFPKYDSITGRIIKAYLEDKETPLEMVPMAILFDVIKESESSDSNIEILSVLTNLFNHVKNDIMIKEPRDKAIYMISALYAVNRYETINYYLNKEEYNDVNFVFDRYYGSNILHQGSLFDDVKKLHAYSNWMKQMEFIILKNWVPSATVFLNATEGLVMKNMEFRGNYKDRLEDDTNRRLMFKYKDEVLKIFPDWKVVSVQQGHDMKDKDKIHGLILDKVKDFIKFKVPAEIHDLTFDQMMSYLIKGEYYARRKSWEHEKFLTVADGILRFREDEIRKDNNSVVSKYHEYHLSIYDYTASDWSVIKKVKYNEDLNSRVVDDRTELSMKDKCNLFYSNKGYTYDEAIAASMIYGVKVRRRLWADTLPNKVYIIYNEFTKNLYIQYKYRHDNTIVKIVSEIYTPSNDDLNATDWEIVD